MPFIDINKKYKTKSGKEVELITTKGRGDLPVVGYVGNSSKVVRWDSKGTSILSGVGWVIGQVNKGIKITYIIVPHGGAINVLLDGEFGFLSGRWDDVYGGKGLEKRPVWQPTKRTLTFSNGSVVKFCKEEDYLSRSAPVAPLDTRGAIWLCGTREISTDRFPLWYGPVRDNELDLVEAKPEPKFEVGEFVYCCPAESFCKIIFVSRNEGAYMYGVTFDTTSITSWHDEENFEKA